MTVTPEVLLKEIIHAADSRKAKDIEAIRVFEQTTLSDYFVVMTGTSSTHIRALSEEIEKKLKENLQTAPHHIEGITSNWILMDYSSVVIHIFMQEARELYAIERLWSDAQKVDIQPYLMKKEEQ
ncbi:ribosome silencing factor [Acidaminobacterium chupaoyuni]